MSERQFVYVEWVDSKQWGLEWRSTTELSAFEENDPQVVRSCGVLLVENNEALVVGLSVTGDDASFQGCLSIPKPAITYRMDLTEVIRTVSLYQKYRPYGCTTHE